MNPLIAAGIALAAAGSQTAHAHSRGMGTLDIRDAGPRILLTWVFYYDELPKEAALDGGPAVSLADPATVKPGLAKLAEVAFQLKMGGRPAPIAKISQLTVLPDKTCLVILSYPAPAAGLLEVRAPVLALLPPNYLINVRFVNAAGKTGSTLIGRDSPPLIALVKGGAGPPEQESGPFRAAFLTEMGTPWVHTNWILLALLLVLSRPLSRQTGALLGAVVILRVVLVQAALMSGIGWPWRVPLCVLCLPVSGLAWLAARGGGWAVGLAAAGTGLVLTLYDLQFLPAGRQWVSALGYNAGFVAGLGLALAIVLALNSEAGKFLQIHEEWRPRICWVVAGVSLWISLYSLVA